MANPTLENNTLARRKPIGEALGTKDTLLPTMPTVIHNATPPTLADGDVAPLQGDDMGNVNVSLGDPAQLALLQQPMPIPEHDTIECSYTSGDLTGVVYKKDGVTVATLTLTYTDGNLTKVELS